MASLVVVISIYSSSSQSPTVIERARDQLRQVTTLETDWNAWTHQFAVDQESWLSARGTYIAKAVPREIELTNVTLPPPYERSAQWKLTLRESPATLFLTTTEGNQPLVTFGTTADGDFFADSRYALKDTLQTLEGVESFWDAATNVHALVTTGVGDAVTVVYTNTDGSRAHQLVQHQTATGKFSGSGSDLRYWNKYGGSNCTRTAEQFGLGRVYCSEERSALMFLVLARFDEQTIPVNLRTWLNIHFNLKVGSGNFADAFAELNEATEFYANQSLKTLSSALKAESERTRDGRDIQLLALTLPGGSIPIIGPMIVLCLQFYLFAHMSVLQGLRPNRLSPGYVPFYSEIWVSEIAALTATLVPVLATGYAGVHAQWIDDAMYLGSSATVLIWIEFLLSGTLAFFAHRSIWILRSRLTGMR